MQDQHSLSMASSIRSKIPDKIQRDVTGLSIIVAGEITERGQHGLKIVKKGYVEARGVASNLQAHIKLNASLKNACQDRELKNLTTYKRG